MTKEPIFIGDNGKYITKALFFENHTYDNKYAVFTLSNRDKIVGDTKYISLKKIYLEMEDLEEYTFATSHLADWQHWEALVNSKWFKPHAEQWRFELSKKLNSRSLLHLNETAKDVDDKNFIQANRLLLSRTEAKKKNNVRELKDEQNKTAGRPKNPAPDTSPDNDIVDSDYKRIMNGKD